jgi:transposase
MARGLKKRKLNLAKELSKVNANVRNASAKRQKTNSGRNLNTTTNRTNRASSRTSIVKPKPGDRSPWWKESNTEIYPVMPRELPGAVAEESELQGNSHSWFSVKRIPLENALEPPDKGWRPHLHVEPEEVWSKEAGGDRKAAASRKGKELAEKPLKQMRARTIRIRFVGDEKHDAKDQEKTVRMWMGAHRFTYNAAVALVRKDKRWLDAKGQYLNEHLVYASKNGRTSKANKDSDEETKKLATKHKHAMAKKGKSLGVQVGALVQENPWLLDVPCHIRKNAIRDVLKAEASNDAKRKVDPRHKWTLKMKKRSSPSAWTMGISNEIIRKVQVLPRPTARQPKAKEGARRKWTRFELSPTYGMGALWLAEEVPGGKLGKDCKLALNARGRFYLVVPYEIENAPDTVAASERRVGAVDPGDRVQATVYSPTDGEVVQYAVGKEGGGKDKVFHLCEKVDVEVTNMAAAKDAVERSKCRKHLAKLRARIRNLVTEARNKIALDMRRRWDTLILPPFETSGMVKRRHRGVQGPRKLHSKVARSLMSWRHYDFSVHVKNVFLRAGKEVLSPDERYTTMTCGACGILGERHTKEEWTCKHCGAFHLRDPAAARCIFLKAIA